VADDNNGEVKERLTRLEERLIAERSVRKTRDDQLFKFISQVHSDMEKQERSLDEISSEIKDVSPTLARIEEGQKNLERLSFMPQENRDAIKEIQGSVKTLKWVWPIVLTLIAAAASLLMANVDLKIKEKPADSGQITSPAE